ncbi:Myelin and lymphocyte protein [Merluccius polli]|uniref:Myelin and lymphocyte protein n=1 Tax=Merluccius polli TaxID=89951 RepID=A0AA47MS36_MERPO|nr:Myelin and lymphocyte protein [Merluccius polli]
MASTLSADLLPSGCRIFTSLPDVFFLPEFVFGGLVWILVASTRVVPANPLGWVMFVSVFCFIMTSLWFFMFACGANQGSIWPSMDVAYHFVAVVMYLSASVALAKVTLDYGTVLNLTSEVLKTYRLDIAAVVIYSVELDSHVLYCHTAIFSSCHLLCSEVEEILGNREAVQMGSPCLQMVRLTVAHTERLDPCVTRTSAQCRRVLGVWSWGSGSVIAPASGRATTSGRAPRSPRNSTTFSRFLSARVWWVSCPTHHHHITIKSAS